MCGGRGVPFGSLSPFPSPGWCQIIVTGLPTSKRTLFPRESDIGTGRLSTVKFQAPGWASWGRKTLGICYFLYRTGDPCGKYFMVSWDSLDSDQVGAGNGWVQRLPVQGRPFLSWQPGNIVGGSRVDKPAGGTRVGRCLFWLGTALLSSWSLQGGCPPPRGWLLPVTSIGTCRPSTWGMPGPQVRGGLGAPESSRGCIGKPFGDPRMSPKAPGGGPSNESCSERLCSPLSPPHLTGGGGT